MRVSHGVERPRSSDEVERPRSSDEVERPRSSDEVERPRSSGLRLREMVEADLEHKVRWANDPEVNRWIVMPEVTLEGTRDWFAAQLADSDVILRILCFGNEPIGYVKLGRDRKAGQGIYHGLAIGEPRYWGRGLGKAAVLEVLELAFGVEGWSRLWGHWPGWNERSIRLHEQLGFHREGLADFRRRDLEGNEHDVWILAATRDAWLR